MTMRRQIVFKTSLLAALFAFLVGVSQIQAQSQADVFRVAFEKAVDANDFSMQAKMVDENKDAAFYAYFLYEKLWVGYSLANNAEAADKQMLNMQYLSSNYRTKHDDKFLTARRLKVAAYTPEQLKAYVEARKAAEEGYVAYNDGAADGNEEAMSKAIAAYSRAARGYMKLGDDYLTAETADFVGRCWLKAGNHFNSAYWYQTASRPAQKAGVIARFPDINNAITKMREKRQVEFPELIDTKLSMADAKVAYDKALAARNQIPTEGSEKSGGKSVGASKAPTSSAEYTFVDDKGFKEKSLPLFTKIKVPYYNFAVCRPNNPRKDPFLQYILLEKDKDPVPVKNFLPGAEMHYDGKVYLKGKKDKSAKKLKLKQKFIKLKKKVVYPDDKSRTITNMVMDYGAESLKLFGKKYNDPNSANQKLIAWLGATGLEGTVRGHKVTLLDCNGNGSFRDTGVDAVMIGKGKKARIEPLGRFILLEENGALYPFEFKVVGVSTGLVRSRPYKGSLAPVRVNFKTASGVRPDFLIVQGSGEDAEAYFDIAKAIDKPMWIPPGRYAVHLGYITLGKGKKQSHILIGRGKSKMEARSGQLNTWNLGGAGENGFRMNCDLSSGDAPGEIVVKGQDIEVIGNMGEVYFNFQQDRLAPTVTIRKENGKGKVLGRKNMKVDSRGQKMIDLWFPTDITIKNCGSSKDKRVGQLVYDHKILGKIVSAWTRVN